MIGRVKYLLAAHVVLPCETASRCHGRRRLVLRVAQQRCRRVLRLPREMLKEKFDRLRRLAVPAVFRKHEIAYVHFAVAEPVVVSIAVVLNPPDHLLSDDDAGSRSRVIGTAPSHR